MNPRFVIFRPLGYVYGMVADTLEVFCDHHQLNALVAVITVLLDQLNQLGFHLNKQVIHLIVKSNDLIGKRLVVIVL